MTSDLSDWHAERRTGIGSSDAPGVVLGPSFPIWAEKTGQAEPPNLDAIEAVEWGNLLESVIIETYSRRSERKVFYNFDHKIVRHLEHDWMLATLDAVQDTAEKGRGVLEAKNVGAYLTADWKDEPPMKFQIQLQHQLAVLGLEWGTLCALMGGNKLVWFDMDRNDKFIDAMIEKEAFFWTQVLDKIPPEPDGSIATRDTLRRMYRYANVGETIDLPEEAAEWDESLTSAKIKMAGYKGIVDANENKLKAAMGTAEFGRLPSGEQYSLKTTKKKAHSVKASTFRQLRRMT